jgi:hypothetical protein
VTWPVLTVKTGDRYPTTWHVPLNLTGSTVRLIARKDGFPAVVLPTTIVDAANGVVEHILTGTLTVGNYRVEMEVTNGTTIVTAPTDTYENLKVIPDLD